MKLELLKNKNFTLLILGKFVSLLGSIMQSFALSLYVLAITGSGTMFASVLAVGIIPRLVLGPFCGVIADWFDRKKIIVYLDFFNGIFIGLLYIVSITVQIQIIHIYIAVLILDTVSSLFQPAISSVIPAIVEKDKLMEANSFNSIVLTSATIIGPILAGLLYGKSGLSLILLVNCISFICSAISEMFIQIPRMDRKNEKLSFSKFKSKFLDGLSFIKNNSILLKLTVCAFFINFAFNPILSVGLTYISKISLKVSDLEFGIMQSILVVGSLVGPLLVGLVSGKSSTVSIFSKGLYVISFLITMVALTISDYALGIFGTNIIPYIILIVISFIIIAVASIVNIAISTLRQQKVPLEYMGRFSAVSITVTMGAVPLGQMLLGWLLDIVPAYVPIVSGAIIVLLCAVYMSRSTLDEDADKNNISTINA